MSPTEAKRPDFFIIGAMKAGTTAIATILAEQAGIAFSAPKEPSLLMRHDYVGMNPTFRPPMDGIENAYARCFAHSKPGDLLGEGSTAYFADAMSPSMVRDVNAEAKIIAVLREPISRTKSAFEYSRSVFQEEADSLDEAIREELAGMRAMFWPNLRYLEYSNYPRHLKAWKANTRPGHLMLLEFEEFVFQPLSTIVAICNFLGVSAPASLPDRRYANKTVSLDSELNRRIMRFLYGESVIKSFLKAIVPQATRYRMKISTQDRLASRPGEHFEVSKYAMNRMREQFAHVESELYTEFGFSPKHWHSLE